MATKIEKLHRKLNDSFSDKLNAAFLDKFSRELTTSFNILSMRLVSFPSDGMDFTPEQLNWVCAYSDGYSAAKNQVWES
ncbi:hypothetical protein [Yersinia rochesterensis]|uniref:Uncharacterized protein n=1 Tax=Yersinia rochesterensis TaxID=1604335 RepID=A0A8D4N6Q6_9GAMM|nr:hypothetical protein [Yersinia rochesterensis]AYD44787.1 hypothetical protein DXZ79_14450 [Yersinia rochesterensis]